MAEVTLTDSNFKEEVLQSRTPVLIDFWAEWCHPCHAVSPIVEELAVEYAGKIKVGKMDVDANPQTPSTYGVMSIPSLLIFKNGQVVKAMVGAQSKENFKKGIEEVLSS